MKDYQLAWRNLWRNRRRTMITAASVFFALFFALLMRSFQLGSYDRMFKNVIESYSGYLQLQHTDYFDDPTIDNSFEIDPSLISKIKKDPNVNDVIPRMESFALAAAGSHTQGVMVMGIVPEGEDKIMKISNKLVKFKLSPEAVEKLKQEALPEPLKKLLDLFREEAWSSDSRLIQDLNIKTEDTALVFAAFRKHASVRNAFLNGNETDKIVIGKGLADYLQAGVGDTIVLVGQGYHGTSAAGKYTVKGIVRLPAPDIDNVIVYLPLEASRVLYAAPSMSTSAVISLNSNDDEDILETGNRLRNLVADPLTVKTWEEMNSLLLNQMEADNKSGMIMVGILYLVIAFGVFGTVLMMLAERRREFGMLLSIGMQKIKLARIVSIEILLVGFLGMIAGIIASVPIVIIGNVHPLTFTGEFARMYEDYGFEPVMPMLLPDTYYFWQVVVIVLILLVAMAYSTRKIFRLDPVNAIRA
ncbi:MAG TPA: FtsX-like permease family protein [Bacteroidales bacterium]|nr:FtsX-like permease family protein [Bacteroidales bacterium]HPJ59336.1 FtsX-like permease family protein [Bacteroidales bacterium]HPR13216.1 FtsX-like permease family protein [Bacteroidales bacterium]HRW83957.1 FtsX-like permease family protein [Bacteroidales bacterium]